MDGKHSIRHVTVKKCWELTDEEAGILQSLEQHPVGEVIMKLIGPELEQIFSEPESETEQMLSDDMPQDMPQSFEGDMRGRDMQQAMEREMA